MSKNNESKKPLTSTTLVSPQYYTAPAQNSYEQAAHFWPQQDYGPVGTERSRTFVDVSKNYPKKKFKIDHS